jgi:hypothetical protein
MKKINDKALKVAIGMWDNESVDRNSALNKKFYDWKKREHLRPLITLAKYGLLMQELFTDEALSELEEKHIK